MTVICPICSSSDVSLVADRVRFDRKANVMKCAGCSLIYLDQSSFELPQDFYESVYHQTYLTHVEPSALDPKSYYEKMLKATKPWSDKVSQRLTGKETVLDFGCSTGHLITHIKDCAERVYGHEKNKKEIAFCRDIMGFDVSGEPLYERFPEGFFDYIVMVFVLEHIAEPVDLLRYLKKFLRPKGKFLVLVPNAQDALLNFFNIPAFPGFYYCVEHLFYYTPKTIEKVFNNAGLKGSIETIQEYPITNHLNWGYRQKPSDVLSSRKLIPDIPLCDDNAMPKWEEFWKTIDIIYKQFLKEQGLGDRIWCVVGE